MIYGIGIDLTSLKKTEHLLKKYGERFLFKVLSEREYREFKKFGERAEDLGARYAGKEAVMKAIGKGIYSGARFKEIEILSTPHSRPEVNLYGNTEMLASRSGVKRILISLSHEADYAIAEAIAEI